MQAYKLKQMLADKFGIEGSYPLMLEVDHETYANVCQEIFNKRGYFNPIDLPQFPRIALGPHNGIMFNGVELILTSPDLS